MTENEISSDMSAFEKQARENLSLSPKKMATFLKQAQALRRNLKLRQKQRKERQENGCIQDKRG